METTAFPNPDAFTNVEAQDFAFELLSRGSEWIHEVLEKKGRSDAHAKRIIAAGETVAAARGRFDVDFDVYVVCDSEQKAMIGNWGVVPWGGHMTDKEERQHILRVRSTGGFTTVILPRRREVSARFEVQLNGSKIEITDESTNVKVDAKSYSIESDDLRVTRRLD